MFGVLHACRNRFRRRLLAWSDSGETESIKRLLDQLGASETSSEPATDRVAADSHSKE